jgi:hypothetical protein
VSSHRIFFTVLKQSVYYIHKICENLQNLKMLFPAMVIGAWNYPYCIFRYTKLHGTRHKDFLTIYMIINFLSISIFRLKMITNQPNATLFWKKDADQCLRRVWQHAGFLFASQPSRIGQRRRRILFISNAPITLKCSPKQFVLNIR